MHDSVLTRQSDSSSSVPTMQSAFLALLPTIECHARIRFHHIRCPQTRADALSDVVALAWLWFRRLSQRGKNAARFIRRLTDFACSHVRAGRRLCGQDGAKDVLSPRARIRHGFVVLSLPQHGTGEANEFDEALQHNTRSEVPEQVSFRLDFPRWRGSHSERDRRVIDALMVGELPGAVARHHGLSAARVSQLRRKLYADWRTFHGESEETPSTSLT